MRFQSQTCQLSSDAANAAAFEKVQAVPLYDAVSVSYACGQGSLVTGCLMAEQQRGKSFGEAHGAFYLPGQ